MPDDFQSKFSNYNNLYSLRFNSNNPDANFISKAIFSIFDNQDKFADGIISSSEFANISKEDYEKYVKEMENYYKSQYGRDLECHIPNYYELKMMLETEKVPDFSVGFGGKKITEGEITEFTSSNGRIGNTEQEGSGDCYLESSIISLSCSQEGRELLSRSYKRAFGGYIITLYGAEVKDGEYVPIGTSGSTNKAKAYYFSQEQLKAAQDELLPNGAKKYNSGDPDMTLFAMAIEQYRKDTQSEPEFEKNRESNKGYDDYLSTGREYEVVKLITGIRTVNFIFKNGDGHSGPDSSYPYKERKIDERRVLTCLEACKKSCWKACTFAPSTKEDEKIMKKYNLCTSHSFAIVDINYETETAILINPWNGKRKKDEMIVMPFSDLAKVISDFDAFHHRNK